MMNIFVIASAIAFVSASLVLCFYRLRKRSTSSKWIPLEIFIGVLLGFLVFWIGEKLF